MEACKSALQLITENRTQGSRHWWSSGQNNSRSWKSGKAEMEVRQAEVTNRLGSGTEMLRQMEGTDQLSGPRRHTLKSWEAAPVVWNPVLGPRKPNQTETESFMLKGLRKKKEPK